MKVPGMPSEDCPHCLNAGGKGAVMKANKGMWVPYEPTNLKKPFRHDAGLCGDPIAQKGPHDHEIGGAWGFPKSPITATYKTGSVVEFIVDLTTNHQGYFEYFLCDATKCGGDISVECFKKGHCHQLMREKTPHCESSQSMECAPVDPAYPGRWYIGCRKGGHVGEDFVGGRSMRYHLPKGFSTKHAVLQWYWVTANSCNPPGFLDFFENHPMDKWGKCGGDGGTIGGRNTGTAECGGKISPEEFWNCADIEINDSGKPSDGDVNEMEVPKAAEKKEDPEEKPTMAVEKKEGEEKPPILVKEVEEVKKLLKHIPEHKIPYAVLDKPAAPTSMMKTANKYPLKFFHIIQHKGSAVPTARHEGGLAYVNGHVYLMGGRGKKEMYSFDTASRKWKALGFPPQGEMHHFQAVSLGDTIYIAGAWYGEWPHEKKHKSMYSYNTMTKEWKGLPMPLAGRNRGAAAVGVYDGKIYMAAGSTGGHGESTKLLPYFDVFDPKLPAEGWKPLADIPHVRDHTAGAVVGKYFCLGGGRLGNKEMSGLGHPVLPIDCYNFHTSKWEIKAKLGAAFGRAGVAVAASCDGLMLIAGGESTGKASTRVDRFNPTTNEFLLPSHMEETRHGFGAATGDCSSGEVYVAAGAGSSGDKPERNTIEVLETGISKHTTPPKKMHPVHEPHVHRPSHVKKEHAKVHAPVRSHPMKHHKKVHKMKPHHGKATKRIVHKPRKNHRRKKVHGSKHRNPSHLKQAKKARHHHRKSNRMSPSRRGRKHRMSRKSKKKSKMNRRRNRRGSRKPRRRRRNRRRSRKSRHRRRTRRGSRKSRPRHRNRRSSRHRRRALRDRRRTSRNRRRTRRHRKRKYGWKHGRKCVLKWNQCGGMFYKGPTSCCRKRTRCVRINRYYSHCKKATM